MLNKNLLQEKVTLRKSDEKLAKAIGIIPALILIIIWYIVKLLTKLLVKFKRFLFKASLIVFVVYGLASFFGQVAHAPYANASQPEYQELVTVSLPMKVTPDMKTREIVLSLVKVEFGEDQVQAFDNIVTHESGWDPKALNPHGGACGLFQALPCSKMKSMELEDQIAFGLGYIKQRYQNPNNAWKFWESQNPHWY